MSRFPANRALIEIERLGPTAGELLAHGDPFVRGLAEWALAIRNVTPGVSGAEGGYGGVKPVVEGGVADRGGHYMFPYPLSEKSFLVSYSYKRPDRNAGQNYSLYYIDVWGNKELIHRDRRMSVAFLSPLKAVARLSGIPLFPFRCHSPTHS